ncbi:hypothetical protein HOY80DRAFT_1005941 [Tuber brumale]|nr:hypothetical protein HOY80DRAFT_1005941 [Tuber brumale]
MAFSPLLDSPSTPHPDDPLSQTIPAFTDPVQQVRYSCSGENISAHTRSPLSSAPSGPLIPTPLSNSGRDNISRRYSHVRAEAVDTRSSVFYSICLSVCTRPKNSESPKLENSCSITRRLVEIYNLGFSVGLGKLYPEAGLRPTAWRGQLPENPSPGRLLEDTVPIKYTCSGDVEFSQEAFSLVPQYFVTLLLSPIPQYL